MDRKQIEYFYQQGEELAAAERASHAAELTAKDAEIARLNAMRTHCEFCGADYMATGIEAGCPCRILTQLRAAEEEIARLKDERDAAYEYIGANFSSADADAYLASRQEQPQVSGVIVSLKGGPNVPEEVIGVAADLDLRGFALSQREGTLLVSPRSGIVPKPELTD